MVLATCSLIGCATYRPPFTCAGPPLAREWPTIRSATVVPGRFELKVLDGPDAKLERRVQIIAEAIPIAMFATKLGDALGQSVSVSQDVMDARVSIVGTLTLNQLFEVLGTSHVRTGGARGGVLEFMSEQDQQRRRESMISAVPFSVAIIPLRRAELAHQLAAMACSSIIGPGASVAVVGENLIVRDRGEPLGKLRSAVEALDGP